MNEYRDAYRSGGLVAVEKLLSKKFPEAGPARVAELERLEDTGDWVIDWHYSSMSIGLRPDHGKIVAYRGGKE